MVSFWYVVLSCNCVLLSTYKGGSNKYQCYLVINKAFLVPDSCRATERNSNSISADVTDDVIEND
jgi:hypothetical protein